MPLILNYVGNHLKKTQCSSSPEHLNAYQEMLLPKKSVVTLFCHKKLYIPCYDDHLGEHKAESARVEPKHSEYPAHSACS